MNRDVFTGTVIVLMALAGRSLGQASIESTSIERIMPPHEVSENLVTLDRVRAELRASNGGGEQKIGDFVAVTSSGGSPTSVHVTMTATPLVGGLWKVERIDDVAQVEKPAKTHTTIVTYVLNAKESQRIEMLLSQERLFDEVDGSAGLCDDRPIVSIRIAAKGRTRATIRIACPGYDPSDVTQQMIDAVEASPH